MVPTGRGNGENRRRGRDACRAGDIGRHRTKAQRGRAASSRKSRNPADETGAIQTDEGLRKISVPRLHLGYGRWAMADYSLRYISLDDSRIVKSQILGDGSRTTEQRGSTYSVFRSPLSRVGMTEKEARRSRFFEVKVARMMTAAVPRGTCVLKATTGMLKAVTMPVVNRFWEHIFSQSRIP